MKYQLYAIKNSENQIKYIGVVIQDRGYKLRFEEHCAASECPEDNSYNTLCHKKIRELGKNNVTITLLLHDIDSEKIEYYEQLYVTKFNTYYKNGDGWNMTIGGYGNCGYEFSEEARQKISSKVKDWWNYIKQYDVEEYNRQCQLRKVAMTGRKISESTRKKLSEHAKTRVGELNPFYGKTQTKKCKDALTKANGFSVIMYDKITHKKLQRFESTVKAGEYLNNVLGKTCTGQCILSACWKDAKTAYGYCWEFEDSSILNDYIADLKSKISKDELQNYYSNHSNKYTAKYFDLPTVERLKLLLCEYNIKPHSKVEDSELSCIQEFGVRNHSLIDK